MSVQEYWVAGPAGTGGADYLSAGAVWPALGATGRHSYLSTGCLHGEHEYCQSDTGAAGTKIPAQCKFCKAPCGCACHHKGGAEK